MICLSPRIDCLSRGGLPAAFSLRAATCAAVAVSFQRDRRVLFPAVEE